MISPQQIGEAMQMAWDEWTSDTGCIPSCFTVRGPITTRISADFEESVFADRVAFFLRVNKEITEQNFCESVSIRS